MNRTLIVWAMLPEENKFYIVDSNSEIATLAQRSAGKYINSADPDLNDGSHAIYRLSDLLSEVEPSGDGDLIAIFNGPFDRVIVCGFYV